MALTIAAKVGILIAAGLFFAASGLISFLVFPKVLRWQVEQKFVLSPEAEPYKYWKDVPVPIYVNFYFFNVTNPDGVMNDDEKPILEEMGPYVYRETREKVNITWNDNGTVSYRQIRNWYFQPHMTPGSLEDVVTTVNIPMVSSANYVRNGEEFMQLAINELIKELNYTLFISKPVRQLLFEGYPDELLKIAKQAADAGEGEADEEFDVPYDHFGWFYEKNGTDDGVYTVFTGEKGMDNYGFIDVWNGNRELSHVWTSPCNEITGTAGDMWPPYTNADRDELFVFVSDVCRSLYVTYNDDVKIKNVKAKRYLGDHTLFDNGFYNQNNLCYCSDNDTCLPHGVLNISECQKGAPALLSYPHFLFGNSSLLNDFQGLHPDPEKHAFIMDLEPHMGIPVNVAARTQVNIVVQASPNIEAFENLKKKIIYPIFWTSQTAQVDDEMAKMLTMVTEDVPHYATVGSFLLVAIGGIILTVTFFYAVKAVKEEARQGRSCTSGGCNPCSCLYDCCIQEKKRSDLQSGQGDKLKEYRPIKPTIVAYSSSADEKGEVTMPLTRC